MAYREFHYEKQYAAPDTNQAYANANQGIGNLFKAIHERGQERKKASDQFAYIQEKGISENDNIHGEQQVKDVVDTMREGLRKGDVRLINQAKNKMQIANADYAEKRKQAELYSDTGNRIAAKTDKYYKKDVARADLDNAFNGEDGKRYFVDRRPALEKAVSNIETSPKYFDQLGFTKDFVTNFAAKSKLDKTGKTVEHTRYDEYPFWLPDGKAGISPVHINQYRTSDPRVNASLEARVNDQLNYEADQSIKNVPEFKGLTIDEAKQYLVENPNDNPINKKPFSQRVNDLAKYDLEQAAPRTTRDQTEYSDKNGSNSKNPNIDFNDSVAEFETGTVSNETGQFNPNTKVSAPSIAFVQKNNSKPPIIKIKNSEMTNVRNGSMTRNNKGARDFHLLDVMAVPYRNDGNPYLFKSKDINGMVDEINSMPFEDLKNFKPKVGLGMYGYTIDDTKTLVSKSVSDKIYKLSQEIGNGDVSKERKEELKHQISELNDFADDVSNIDTNSDEFNPNEYVNRAAQLGVRSFKNDWIVEANDENLSNIKGLTSGRTGGGLNLRDRKNWNEGFTKIADAFEKRYQQAKEQGYKSQQAEPEKTDTTIPSDGKDLKSWTTENQYKVGNSVYYFDKADSTWKKK